MKRQQSQWKSSTGFILASVGSATGLSAVWKLPYMAGIYDSGTFLAMFLIFTIFVGLPLLIMEFAIGKIGRTYTIQIYDRLTGKKWLNIIGWSGNLAVSILFGFYSAIDGWIVIYIGQVLWQLVMSQRISHLQEMNFEAVISNPWLTVLGQGIFIFATMVIVMLNVEKGLEKALKVMMPLLFVFLIIIVIKSLTLDGTLKSVKFILQPRVSEITADGILLALGQSFLTLLLGTISMIAYAGYASKGMAIKSSAISIVVMSVFVSILASLAILPTLRSFDYEPQEGPGLLFKALSIIFSQMHLDTLFYLGFLVLFLLATLASSISLLELNVSNFTKNDNTKRKKVVVIGSILVFIISILAILSFGILKDVKFDVGTIFDNMDFIVSSVLISLGALDTTLVIGQLSDKELLQQYFGKDRFRLFNGRYYLVKYVVPVVIILVLIVQLFS